MGLETSRRDTEAIKIFSTFCEGSVVVLGLGPWP